MKKYTIDEIETMTKEEIKVMLNEFEEVLRDKDIQIKNLKEELKRNENIILQREDKIKKLDCKVELYQSMFRGIVDYEF